MGSPDRQSHLEPRGAVDLALAGGDVLGEVLRADAVIRPFVDGPVLLRPEECAERHLAAAERAGRGIVLLHDNADDPRLSGRNRTAALVRLLVPALVARGYRFVGLDQVPEVRKAMAVTARDR
jgi:hypothetical protein